MNKYPIQLDHLEKNNFLVSPTLSQQETIKDRPDKVQAYHELLTLPSPSCFPKLFVDRGQALAIIILKLYNYQENEAGDTWFHAQIWIFVFS